jgi:hypothetical protein
MENKNLFDVDELELLIEAMDELNKETAGHSGVSPQEIFGGMFTAGSREEVEQKIKEQVTQAKIEFRTKKRKIALLLAKLIQMQMDAEVAGLFTPQPAV